MEINGDSQESPDAGGIALKTLKERCRTLQRRISVLEKENVRLSGASVRSDPEKDDVESLKATVSRLIAEKAQLVEHIYIIADENKKLWSTLDKAKPQKDVPVGERAAYIVPALARSQTFTQTSPSTRLSAVEAQDKDLKNSLEDISLKLINTFVVEKTELVNQYEQMVELQMDPSNSVHSDSATEIRKQVEKITENKRLAIQQQIYLKKILNALETRKLEKEECQECLSKNLPPTNEKQGFADSSVARLAKDLNKREIPNGISSSNNSDINYSKNSNQETENKNINDLLKTKNVIDARENATTVSNIARNDDYWRSNVLSNDPIPNNNITKMKICPMCAKIFSHIPFTEFELHVQNHFIGDDEFDSLHDNFEVVATID